MFETWLCVPAYTWKALNYWNIGDVVQENSSEEMQKRMKTTIIKMVAFFPDPSKAEDSFTKLSQMKDNSIFNSLALLLDEVKFRDALNNRVILLFPFLLLTKDFTFPPILPP